MPLVNYSTPNLIQGVSQQADAVRYDGQCEEQENALSSVADGLKKRPNTRHIAKLLDEAIAEDSFVHFIDRTSAERYVVIHNGSKLLAYNLITGAEATINGSTGGLEIGVGDYLEVSEPNIDVKALTLADSTFLLNSTKTVAPKEQKTDPLEKEAVVFVRQGDYKKDYRVDATIIPKGGTGLAPNNFIAPEFQFVFTRFVTDSQRIESRGIYRYTKYWYQHRLAAVYVTNAGSNITGTINFSFTSSHAIYEAPQVRANITNGIVTSVDILNTGSFEGAGDDGNERIDYYPPTIQTAVTGGYVTDTTSIHAKIQSGEGTNASTANNANTDVIAEQLETQMETTANPASSTYAASDGGGFTGFFTTRHENTDANIYITMSESSAASNEFSISTSDSLADTGLQSVYKEIDSLTSLPISNKNGFRVKIIGDAEAFQDDYYVKFSTDSGAQYGKGSYKETVGFDIDKGYEPATMPHVLKSIGENEFTFGVCKYADRLCGDDETNPLPTFVGRSIENMFFFKNRLGFLSNEHIIMSENGLGQVDDLNDMVYNFGRTTVTSLLDSDPIDVSVSSGRVTNLKSAQGFQENLVLFADGAQFVLKGGDLLTPSTVNISPITNFSYDSRVKPLALGSYIYFPFTRGLFTGLCEFTINASTEVYDALEVTEHVPSYIPSNIVSMAGTTAEDMIVLLSEDDKSSLYVYNYFWSGQKKLQSAWSKFTFLGDILSVEFIESVLYVVTTHNNQTHLLSLPLETGLTDDAGYVTHLDYRFDATVTAGDVNIPMPYILESTDVIEVYTKTGSKLEATHNNGIAVLKDPLTEDTDVWVGVSYTMKYVFSEQVFKASAGQTRTPSSANKLMLKNASIFFNESGYFKAKVTPKLRDTKESVFVSNKVGQSIIGDVVLESGYFRFPIFSSAEDTVISLENSSALPSTFNSAEFETFTHGRSSRYG